MGELGRVGDKRLWLLELDRPYRFVSPFDGDEFAVLIGAQDPTITPHEQMALSDQVVQQGCRYALAMGINASSWDTSLDLAYILNDPLLDPPEHRCLMTTWHDDEPPEDVAEWLILNTSFDDFVPVNFLILSLGPRGDLHERVVTAAMDRFLKGRMT
jgi:hypothetical protein